MSNEECVEDLRREAGEDKRKAWQTPGVEVLPTEDTGAYVVGDHVDAEWGDPFLS